jgi:hypothetical protein
LHARYAPQTAFLHSSHAAEQYARGFTGARWAATDDNGDGLVFTIEIRGVQEAEWKLLKDRLREKYWSWDSTAFPDASGL